LTIACTLLVQQIMITRGESHSLFSRVQLEWHFRTYASQTVGGKIPNSLRQKLRRARPKPRCKMHDQS
jgi:hypothetical protein